MNDKLIIKSKFPEYDPDLLIITLDGYSDYGFTMRGISVETREWLKGVITSQLVKAYQRGFIEGQKSIKKPIKEALSFINE